MSCTSTFGREVLPVTVVAGAEQRILVDDTNEPFTFVAPNRHLAYSTTDV